MSAIEITEQTICQPVIVKNIGSNQRLVKELVRSTVTGLMQGRLLPVGVDEGELMFKKLPGANLAEIWDGLSENQQMEMMQKLALLLMGIERRFNEDGKQLIEVFDKELGWRDLLTQLDHFLDDEGARLKISSGVLEKWRKLIEKYKKVKTTLVHGDLGLSNILLSGRDVWLIDFEHTVEGPLELELAVAKFWQDANSIPVGLLMRELEGLGRLLDAEMIEAMTVIYLLRQLRIAVENGEEKKIRQLLIIAKERQLI